MKIKSIVKEGIVRLSISIALYVYLVVNSFEHTTIKLALDIIILLIASKELGNGLSFVLYRSIDKLYQSIIASELTGMVSFILGALYVYLGQKSPLWVFMVLVGLVIINLVINIRTISASVIRLKEDGDFKIERFDDHEENTALQD